MSSERADGTVVSIGVFDGVHRGHQALVRQAAELARARGLPLVVVTFDPHPMVVTRPGSAPQSLASLDDRVAMLTAAGADEVDVIRFDAELSHHTPEEFVQAVLVDRLCARAVVVGANFRFGANASGDIHTLSELGSSYGFDVVVAELQADSAPWSSTRVREALANGDVVEAAAVLGRNYRLAGVVVHGDQRGRTLGIPTANFRLSGNPVVPADGVYAGWLWAVGERFPAAISVGSNPQFDGQDRRVEVHALGRTDLELYGEDAQAEFAAFLRAQATYDSLDAFMAQLQVDLAQARSATQS